MLEMLEQKPPYSDIIEEIENAPLTQRVIKRGTAKYRIRDHSLCIHEDGFEKDREYWRMIVPDDKEVKAKLLTEIHSVPYTGHPGISPDTRDGPQAQVLEGHVADIRDFVLECPVCQIEKGESRQLRGELQNLKIPEKKWSEIILDFITKLPKTARGTTQY